MSSLATQNIRSVCPYCGVGCGIVMQVENGRVAKVIKGPPAGKPWVDALNPDPRLKSRPLVGMPILTEMAASGDGWKGKIFDPKTGKTYRAVVARDGANLKVQGCIAIFCQTMVWTRAG